MLRALLFDFNGILVNDEPLHLALFQRVLGEEGLDLSRDDYYALYLGFDDRDCFAAVFAAAGEPCPPERLVRLIARKAAYYRDEIRRSGYPLFPGAAEFVLAWSGRRPLAVASNSPPTFSLRARCPDITPFGVERMAIPIPLSTRGISSTPTY